MINDKIRVAVVFGGRSVEHEVSIVTAMQIFENINRNKYDIIPVYIDKSGRWLVGEELGKIESFKNLKLKEIKAPEYFFAASPSVKSLLPKSAIKSFFSKISADIYFPAVHGTFGEDGTLQGIFEIAGVPYVGSGVTGSAVGMDKIIQKSVFKDNGIPVVNYVWFSKNEWENEKDRIIKYIEKTLHYPVFVKPANLGSSIAINRATGFKELQEALDIASHFDRRLIVEEGKVGIIEINCSVIGNNKLIASVCEQPIKNSEILTYEDKYLKGGKVKGMAGLSRLVPAPISEELAKKIRETAMRAFKAVDAAGISRVDFMVKPDSEEFWITEINTLPGSLSFYLWEKSGISFSELLDRLINLGFERYKERQELTFSYDSDLISKVGGGTKK
ncbi:MAG: D-alanine--D-alanine ligase family protein [Candidatus Azambacteria bacterium]|nr:D-alanine--D-alanine ligase family protein [Candidatus Azambacteria bacterium]